METYTLDQLREDVERKYQDFVIHIGEDDVVRFRSPMRLKKADRDALNEMFKVYRETQEESPDSSLENADKMQHMLRSQLLLLASDKDAAQRLLNLIGDDLATLSELLDKYNEATQVGEASPSQE